MMRQVLVRKGKANCVVTDDWGWNLLHEVRMKKIMALTMNTSRTMV